MYRKLLIALAVAALIPFAFAACGGDDEEETTDAATTEETTPTETGGGGGGGASTVELTADPGGALAFEQSSAEAEAGEVTLELTNESSLPHDVKVEGPDGDLGGTDTVTGGTTSATVELEPGEYTFYCSVPGHRDGGMEGTLTVE